MPTIGWLSECKHGTETLTKRELESAGEDRERTENEIEKGGIPDPNTERDGVGEALDMRRACPFFWRNRGSPSCRLDYLYVWDKERRHVDDSV